MYKAYQVHLADHAVLADAEQIEEMKRKNAARVDIGNFVDDDGVLNGSEIIDKWFPQGDFDVFISHSHADETKALALSSYLERKMGLKCFVDSCVWRYSDEALRLLDNKFCTNSGSDPRTYCYDRRNITTTHVHNMLAVSLASMMDKCECIFFLNSENSLESKVSIANSAGNTTNSPWLYNELNLCRILQKNVPDRHMWVSKASMEAMNEARTDRQVPPFRYNVDIDYMTKLEFTDIVTWAHANNRLGLPSLDWLYSNYEMEFSA
ncbi:TIR domain-containing protein [Novosphingobium clariflavum]|uniref:TIR domain-containing protein n=1 Tax=Novosphingobium clariflavum TaxID=2029884 RepID=A0ABV6S456_9SPHN|nr:hypothetical protein [Novosphingobium clariflavum]